MQPTAGRDQLNLSEERRKRRDGRKHGGKRITAMIPTPFIDAHMQLDKRKSLNTVVLAMAVSFSRRWPYFRVAWYHDTGFFRPAAGWHVLDTNS